MARGLQKFTSVDDHLPEGWNLTGTDREVFRLHDADIVTWAAMADGPDGSAMAVVASEDKSGSIWALRRRILGDLLPTEGWALPAPAGAALDPDHTTVFADDENDPEVREAVREAEAALPPGWVLYETDARSTPWAAQRSPRGRWARSDRTGRPLWPSGSARRMPSTSSHAPCAATSPSQTRGHRSSKPTPLLTLAGIVDGSDPGRAMPHLLGVLVFGTTGVAALLAAWLLPRRPTTGRRFGYVAAAGALLIEWLLTQSSGSGLVAVVVGIVIAATGAYVAWELFHWSRRGPSSDTK